MKQWGELQEEARFELARMTDDHRRRGFDWMMLKVICRMLHRHNVLMEDALKGRMASERMAGRQIAILERLMTGRRKKKRLAKVSRDVKLAIHDDTSGDRQSTEKNGDQARLPEGA